jgi:hypothetical protein
MYNHKESVKMLDCEWDRRREEEQEERSES